MGGPRGDTLAVYNLSRKTLQKWRTVSQSLFRTLKLCELVNEICNKGYSHIMIIGDFNYKDINWVEMYSPIKVERNFLNCIGDNYLHQHVTEPTRWRGNDQPNILDLIITNEEDMISCIDYQCPIGKSDHAILVFDFECYAEENIEVFTKKKYHKANYDKMKEYVNNINWDELLKDKDIDVQRIFRCIRED